MRTVANRFASPLLALLLAVSLAFGVSSALAQPAPASACPFDLAYGEIGTSCVTNADCTAPCKFYYPDSPGGFCRSGCCRCAY